MEPEDGDEVRLLDRFWACDKVMWGDIAEAFGAKVSALGMPPLRDASPSSPGTPSFSETIDWSRRRSTLKGEGEDEDEDEDEDGDEESPLQDAQKPSPTPFTPVSNTGGTQFVAGFTEAAGPAAPSPSPQPTQRVELPVMVLAVPGRGRASPRLAAEIRRLCWEAEAERPGSYTRSVLEARAADLAAQVRGGGAHAPATTLAEALARAALEHPPAKT